MAARVILGATYGLDIHKKDDPHVLNAEAVQGYLTACANQGSYLVNSIPILKYVPEWVPGAIPLMHLAAPSNICRRNVQATGQGVEGACALHGRYALFRSQGQCASCTIRPFDCCLH